MVVTEVDDRVVVMVEVVLVSVGDDRGGVTEVDG